MQTVQENKTNYLVFPSSSIDTSSLPTGSENVFILFAYQSMANDSSSYQYASASVDTNDRWRTATTELISSGTETTSSLKLQAGTTYELQLRYGQIEEAMVWGEVSDTWGETSVTWGDAYAFNPNNTVILERDRMFVSGSVSPTQKIYVSSNEDATLKIYQG